MAPLNPASARVVDAILTAFAQGYVNPERVGHHLFPHVTVYVSGGKIIKFGKEHFQLFNMRRAPGSAARRVMFGYEAGDYAVHGESLDAVVPREFVRDAQQGPGVELATGAVEMVLDLLNLSIEYEQAQLAITATNYAETHKVDLTAQGKVKWSHENGRPAVEIDAGREAIRRAVGLYPNTLLLSATAYQALRSNPAVVERFKYTGRDSITAEMLGQLFDIPKVVVGGAVTANAAGVNSDVWGNNAVLAYVAPSSAGVQRNRARPSYGYTYVMDGHPLVEAGRWDADSRSWLYGCSYERAAILSGQDAGYLIQNPA
jgi:hypothetical protein